MNRQLADQIIDEFVDECRANGIIALDETVTVADSNRVLGEGRLRDEAGFHLPGI
ncbi:hypothetical protein [Streptomyces agglomeratus]|uniref:hypothetical protein n=1 Tax=Streptomyces agglomeratus TaxID=285458 RepID=UPI00159F1702|nr:hypothetical protein [Streptomyces agglomeratus]